MREQLTASRAKELLLPIPEENFITGIFTDGESKCCVMGHLQRLTSDNPDSYQRENCKDISFYGDLQDTTGFRRKTRHFLSERFGVYSDIAEVNNENTINGYTEESIKARVMHLLDDMIAAGY